MWKLLSSRLAHVSLSDATEYSFPVPTQKLRVKCHARSLNASASNSILPRRNRDVRLLHLLCFIQSIFTIFGWHTTTWKSVTLCVWRNGSINWCWHCLIEVRHSAHSPEHIIVFESSSSRSEDKFENDANIVKRDRFVPGFFNRPHFGLWGGCMSPHHIAIIFDCEHLLI